MNKWIFISYVVFLTIFTLFSYLFVDGNLPYLQFLFTDFAFKNRLITTIAYSTLLSLFFGYYFYFIRLVQQKKLSMGNIRLLVIVTIGILLLAYPAMLSYDIFNYITTAKVTYFYHENPYIIMPIEFIHDPLLLFTHAANKIALYGPTWILFSGVPFFLGFGNFLLTLFLFKITAALSFFGVLFLYYKLHKDHMSLVLFAMNPLVLIETLVSGHNDMFVMFLVFLGIFFIQKNKFTGWLLFILSIGVKYATLFLFPIFLLSLFYKNLNKKSFFQLSAIMMFIIFLLSPLREEIYPWYAIWFLPFVFLSGRRLFIILTISLCFGLLLRYIPFMLLGTYLDPTPEIKIIVMVIPVFLAAVSYLLWLKKSFHYYQ